MKALLVALCASPIPQPRPLTRELLVGEYAWDWGMMKDGWLSLHNDGTYCSRHSPGANPDYGGLWVLYDGKLILKEGRMPCDERGLEAVTTYEIRLCTKDWPLLRGQYGDTPVTLRRKP